MRPQSIAPEVVAALAARDDFHGIGTLLDPPHPLHVDEPAVITRTASTLHAGTADILRRRLAADAWEWRGSGFCDVYEAPTGRYVPAEERTSEWWEARAAEGGVIPTGSLWPVNLAQPFGSGHVVVWRGTRFLIAETILDGEVAFTFGTYQEVRRREHAAAAPLRAEARFRGPVLRATSEEDDGTFAAELPTELLFAEPHYVNFDPVTGVVSVSPGEVSTFHEMTAAEARTYAAEVVDLAAWAEQIAENPARFIERDAVLASAGVR